MYILGTELLVWYGQEYARELGMIRDKNLLLVPKYINGEGMYRAICLVLTNIYAGELGMISLRQKSSLGSKVNYEEKVV